MELWGLGQGVALLLHMHSPPRQKKKSGCDSWAYIKSGDQF